MFCLENRIKLEDIVKGNMIWYYYYLLSKDCEKSLLNGFYIKFRDYSR